MSYTNLKETKNMSADVIYIEIEYKFLKKKNKISHFIIYMYNRNNMTINNKKKQKKITSAVAVAMGYWKSFDHEVTART